MAELLILIALVAFFVGVFLIKRKIDQLKYRARESVYNKVGLGDSQITSVTDEMVEKGKTKKFLENHPTYTEESIKELLKSFATEIVNKNLTHSAEQKVIDKLANDNKISKYALLIVVCLNVTFNGLYYYSSHGYRYSKWFLQYKNLDYVYKESGGSFNDFDKIIDKIKESDDGFYRISKYPNSYGNLSILYNYNSFDSYLSLVNGAQVNYSKDLNNSVRRTSNSIGNFDNRTIATNILGGKYFIVDKSNLEKVPYGYYDYMDFNNGNTLVLKNKYYLSPFIFYDNYVLEKDYNKLDPLYKEESNLSTVSIKSKDVVGGLDINNNMPNIDNIKKLDCKITDRDRNNSHFELDCDGVSNSNIFVNIVGFEILKSYDGSYSYGITAVRDDVVNAKSFANKFVSAYYQEIPELLLNLGYVSSNDSNKIVIDARKDREYKVSRIEVYAVSMDSYSEKIEALSKNKFEIEDWKDGYIKGKINNDVDGILQLSTGYSKG